jgi:hypothetical protein
LTARTPQLAIIAMKQTQRLRLEPRPSWIAGAAIIAACAATAMLVAVMRMAIAPTVGCMAVVITVLVSSLRRCVGRGVPAIFHVGLDRRITVTDGCGRSHPGAILEDSYVGSALTTIVWRADGDRWWRPARVLLVVPDSLSPDEFRHLRVVLRYGRPPREAATSGVDAA